MQNDIIRTAHKFINKTLKGKSDLNSIISYLGSIGYQLIEYQNEDEPELIEKYELSEKIKVSHAFTVNDEEIKGVFFNNSLSAEGKKYAIYHEASHIALGHLTSSELIINERLREMQAEAFAYQMLTYKKTLKKSILKIIIVVLITAGLTFGTSYLSSNLSVPYTDIVYITPSGTKFHRDSCYYTKGHKTTSIARDKAIKTHEPCLICNP